MAPVSRPHAAHPGNDEAEVVRLVRRNASEMDVGADDVVPVVAADALQRRLEVVGRLAVAHRPVCGTSEETGSAPAVGCRLSLYTVHLTRNLCKVPREFLKLMGSCEQRLVSEAVSV